jgi:hypothetical protein
MKHILGGLALTAGQSKQFEKLNQMTEDFTHSQIDFWQKYSNLNSWQFWFLVCLLAVSLISLYLFIDRRKALLLGFFGINVHVWFTKFDEIAIDNGLWNYPYKLIPFLTASFALGAAFIPVVFMLVYQWTLKYNKNFYLYATVLCLFLALIWKPTLSTLGLFRISNGINYIYLFLGYFTVMLVSKWITNLFVHFQKEPEHPFRKKMNLNILPKKQKINTSNP